MAFHCELNGLDIHVINTWTYANSAAREAATGFTADDVYKVAVQEDNKSLWALTNHSPITWVNFFTGDYHIHILDEGTPLGLFEKINFVGNLVDALDSGGSVATVTISGATISYVDTQVASLSAASDEGDNQTLALAQLYSDSASANAETQANAYTDTQIASVSAASDEGDNATLAAAILYTDTEVASVSAAADAGDDATLASAQTYAESASANALTQAENYTDTQVASVSAASVEGDNQTLEAAQTYAESASANAYQQVLNDDYMPTDASKAFTNPVSGIDPTLDNHLATKSYTDAASANALAQAGGVGGSTHYEYASVEGESTTTSTTPIQKTRLTTTSLPSGSYKIDYSFELSVSSGKGAPAPHVQVQINDTTTIAEFNDSGNDDYIDTPFIPHSGFYIGTLNGVNTIDVDYWDSNGETVGIRRCRVALSDVSL